MAPTEAIGEEGREVGARMASGDLRDLLARLGTNGQILRVKKEVDPKFELAAVTTHVQQRQNLPILFENVKGTRFPVVSNLYGNYAIVAEMLGTSHAELAATWAAITDDQRDPSDPVQTDRPVELHDLALSEIPHVTFCEKDAGPYLTAAVVLVKDPSTGTPNLSYHRMQMIDETELRARLSPSGDLFRIHQAAEKAGRALEVAILIGTGPAISLASAAVIASGKSELDLATRISGRAFPLRRCASVDLEVPDETEFVIEAEILAGVRRPEGPFGEWQGYYVPRADNHVLKVRRSVARRDAVFHAIVSGSCEELALTGIPNAAAIYRALRTVDPSVKDVVCHPSPQFCVIRIEKRYEGQPQKLMLAAMGAELNRMLYCVVVDDDVDSHDLSDVIWAISTRCRPDRDIIQIPNVPSYARDPHHLHWGRLGIDATAPLEWRDEFERKRFPGLESIRLEDYV